MLKLFSVFLILKLRFKLWNFRRVQNLYNLRNRFVLRLIAYSMKIKRPDYTTKFKELLLLQKDNQKMHQQIFVLQLTNNELNQAIKRHPDYAKPN
jgi:hypothetical protein